MQTYTITQEKLGQLLQIIYQTNITAQGYDAIRAKDSFFVEVKDQTPITPEAKPTE